MKCYAIVEYDRDENCPVDSNNLITYLREFVGKNTGCEFIDSYPLSYARFLMCGNLGVGFRFIGPFNMMDEDELNESAKNYKAIDIMRVKYKDS